MNNTCLDLPTEGNNVISVSSIGPSKTKSDFSNWSYEETTVAAPGGWFRDTGWTPGTRSAASRTRSSPRIRRTWPRRPAT